MGRKFPKDTRDKASSKGESLSALQRDAWLSGLPALKMDYGGNALVEYRGKILSHNGAKADANGVRRPMVGGAYLMNPPILDDFVWKGFAVKLRSAISAWETKTGLNFWYHFDAATAIAGDNSVTMDEALAVDYLVTYIRDYVDAMTQWMCAVAQIAATYTRAGSHTAGTLALAVKPSTLISVTNRMKSYPFISSVMRYITGNTRVLEGITDFSDNYQFYPLWKVDACGPEPSFFPLASLNPHDSFPTREVTDYPDPPVMPRFGIKGADQSEMSNGLITWLASAEEFWRQYVSNNFAPLTTKDEKSLTYILSTVVGLFDMDGIDNLMLINSVKDNGVGDARKFASDNMAFRSKAVADLGYRRRDTRHCVGGIVDDGNILTYSGTLLEFAYSVNNSNPNSQNDTRGVLQSNFLINGRWAEVGILSGGAFGINDAGTDVMSTYFFQHGVINLEAGAIDSTMDQTFVELFGVDAAMAERILLGEDSNPVYLIHEEQDAGFITKRQAVRPLIDVNDITMCGFYVISDTSSEPFSGRWSRFLDGLHDSKWADDGAYSPGAMQIYFVGDAWQYDPLMAFSRAGISHVPVNTFTGWTITGGDLTLTGRAQDYLLKIPTKPYLVKDVGMADDPRTLTTQVAAVTSYPVADATALTDGGFHGETPSLQQTMSQLAMNSTALSDFYDMNAALNWVYMFGPVKGVGVVNTAYSKLLWWTEVLPRVKAIGHWEKLWKRGDSIANYALDMPSVTDAGSAASAIVGAMITPKPRGNQRDSGRSNYRPRSVRRDPPVTTRPVKVNDTESASETPVTTINDESGKDR